MMSWGKCSTTWCTTDTLEQVANSLFYEIIKRDANSDSSIPTEVEVMEIAKRTCSSEKNGNYNFFCDGRERTYVSNERYGTPSREYVDFKKHKLTDIVSLVMKKLGVYYIVPPEQRRQTKEDNKIIRDQLLKISYRDYVRRRQGKENVDNYLYYDDEYYDWFRVYGKAAEDQLRKNLQEQRQPTRAGRRKYAKRTRKYRKV